MTVKPKVKEKVVRFEKRHLETILETPLVLSQNKRTKHDNLKYQTIYYRIFGEFDDRKISNNFHEQSKIQAFREWVEKKHNIECYTIIDDTEGDIKSQEQLIHRIDDTSPEFCVVPTKVAVTFKWCENGEHKNAKEHVDATRTIQSICGHFRNTHGQDYTFNKISSPNYLRSRSRFTNAKSVQNDRIVEFWRFKGLVTIEMVSSDDWEEQKTGACVCGHDLKWRGDVENPRVMMQAKKECRSCGKQWSSVADDVNATLWCPLGITKIHPKCFMICPDCSTSVVSC